LSYIHHEELRNNFFSVLRKCLFREFEITPGAGQIEIRLVGERSGLLVFLVKAEIIRKGTALGLDYSLTHSCYDPSPEGAACGACDSCLIRKKGFADAGIKDPTRYR
jgi:7-cyano-7-deazaguanine synthase in queuosine biosynthesis